MIELVNYCHITTNIQTHILGSQQTHIFTRETFLVQDINQAYAVTVRVMRIYCTLTYGDTYIYTFERTMYNSVHTI